MQVTVPADAKVAASFQYQANDSRGGTATAKVTLAVKDRSANEAPAQKRFPHSSLEQGKSTSQDILTYCLDPDGDDLLLVSAVGV
jgi:hypothetical protein